MRQLKHWHGPGQRVQCPLTSAKRKVGKNLVSFEKRIRRCFWFRGGSPIGLQRVNKAQAKA